ncbi:hypothetical protein [Geomicrobium sp. JCM 19039]|uniref:hypothetical protein n=1 Tax=Geomicrobium sp. JCM 19039 TaxID=1460636 RepID=UPI00045F40B8|nr:hypothetical protein [Geomicrobium sp. JCM 19039]GAK14050.1 hypothetical protein JCM19039_3944 [Geomicrobium sp. JCM 19039]
MRIKALFIITLCIVMASCQSAQDDLAQLEEEYGVSFTYNEPQDQDNSIVQLEYDQIEALVQQVSQFPDGESVVEGVELVDFAVGELPLIFELDAVGESSTAIGRIIDGSIGWEGERGKSAWAAIDDYEEALDWSLLNEANSYNVGMAGVAWQQQSISFSEDSEEVALTITGSWLGQFRYRDSIVTFNHVDDWMITIEKHALITFLNTL